MQKYKQKNHRFFVCKKSVKNTDKKNQKSHIHTVTVSLYVIMYIKTK